MNKLMVLIILAVSSIFIISTLCYAGNVPSEIYLLKLGGPSFVLPLLPKVNQETAYFLVKPISNDRAYKIQVNFSKDKLRVIEQNKSSHIVKMKDWWFYDILVEKLHIEDDDSYIKWPCRPGHRGSLISLFDSYIFNPNTKKKETIYSTGDFSFIVWNIKLFKKIFTMSRYGEIIR